MLTRKYGKRSWQIVALGALVTLAVAACGSSSNGTGSAPSGSSTEAGTQGTKSPVKIGWVGSKTGANEVAGTTELAGLQAWVGAVNAQGGVNGHPVDLIVKDDAGDPARGLAAVKDLVENSHVIALVGVHANTTEPSWASYVEQKQIPVVGGESDTVVWLQNPMFFVSGEPGTTTLDTEAYLAKAIGKKSLASINVGTLQSTGPLIDILKASTAKYGVEYPYHTVVNPSEPNYTATCLAVKQSGADVVVLNLDPNTLSRLSSDCYRQNLKLSYSIPSGAFGGVDISQPQFDGAYIPTNNFLWFTDTPAAQEFRAAMQKYEPKANLDPNATQGWSGGKLFEAATKNLPDNPTAKDVLDGLYALSPNDTLGGVSPGNTFTQGKPATTTNCFFLAQIKDKKLIAPEGTDPICPTKS